MLPVIPTLNKGTVDILDDRQTQVWHIVTFALNNPGNTSDTSEKDMVSFRKLEARFGNDQDRLAAEFKLALQGVIDKYFTDLVVEVEAITTDATKFKLEISVADTSNVLVLQINNVNVSRDGIEMSVDYDAIGQIKDF